nr:MAG TPA: hypothetical protein [Bacteriophage sp.]
MSVEYEGVEPSSYNRFIDLTVNCGYIGDQTYIAFGLLNYFTYKF